MAGSADSIALRAAGSVSFSSALRMDGATSAAGLPTWASAAAAVARTPGTAESSAAASDGTAATPISPSASGISRRSSGSPLPIIETSAGIASFAPGPIWPSARTAPCCSETSSEVTAFSSVGMAGGPIRESANAMRVTDWRRSRSRNPRPRRDSRPDISAGIASCASGPRFAIAVMANDQTCRS